MRAQTIQGERSPLSLTEHCCPTKLATDLPSAETSWRGVVQRCENSPDPHVPRWKIPGASIRGHQSRAPICSHYLQAGKSLAACGGAAAALPQPRWELGWAGLGIAKHPSCTFKSRPFGVGFHLLQGFGEGNTERECLTYMAVCTWSPRAGDGSLAMPRLVSGAAPS